MSAVYICVLIARTSARKQGGGGFNKETSRAAHVDLMVRLYILVCIYVGDAALVCLCDAQHRYSR